ncbi:MAG: spore coat protein CotJB [Eubacterium sp.]|nr:spore coat protein CotJB [Eubacterium sp.]
MTREQLLLRVSQAQFAMWEVRMYMDTHLDNAEARKLYEKYFNQFKMLKKEFEEKYGPLTLGENNSDEWLKDPWPWDAE